MYDLKSNWIKKCPFSQERCWWEVVYISYIGIWKKEHQQYQIFFSNSSSSLRPKLALRGVQKAKGVKHNWKERKGKACNDNIFGQN